MKLHEWGMNNMLMKINTSPTKLTHIKMLLFFSELLKSNKTKGQVLTRKYISQLIQCIK